MSDHQWQSTVTTVTEEAVAEELYYHLIKSCLQQLYFNKLMEQLLHFVFMFTVADNLVTDENVCKWDEFYCKGDKLYCKRDEVNCKNL